MRRWFIILSIMAIMISACSVINNSGDADSQTAEENTSENESNSSLVNWERDPLTIVFQADVISSNGVDNFIGFNRVPLCTIYGDGRMVWLSEDNEQVLFDLLTDEQIEDFVTYLTVEERFYTFTSGLDTLIPSSDFPITEVLSLNVNGIEHTTDSFGGWTEDYFVRISNNCISLSQQPRIFQPSEGWFSILYTTYDSSIPSIPWDSEATGVNLSDVLESPGSSIWLEGGLAVPIWTSIRDNGERVQFSQDGNDYFAVLRVPGVTVDAPPPPTEDNPFLPDVDFDPDAGDS